MRAISCPTCGAQLAPGPHDVRVPCRHCGSTVEVTSEGVARVAAVLQRAGVRVSGQPMTIADIDAELAARAADERDRRHRAIIGAVVFSLVVAVVLGVVLLSTASGP